MTLKEKFLLFVDWNDWQEYYINRDWAIKNAERCEKIADDYAIEFGEYLDSLTVEDIGTTPIKDLLEIFKKEKGWI